MATRPSNVARSGQHAGRVVRRVHDDEPGRGRDLPAQEVEIERPAGVLAQLVQGHVRAGRPGDLVQALVARPRDDGVVARPQQHVDQTEDRLLGPGEDEDVVGREAVVQGGDLATQQRMTARLRVAQGQAVPQGPGLVVGQGEQLAHRVALHVRGAQQVLDGELPAGEVALQGEVGDAHLAIVAEGVAARAAEPEPGAEGALCSGAWQGSIRSSSSVRRPRSAAISRAWNARPPSCAPTGCSTSSRPSRRGRADTVLDHGDARQRSGLGARSRPADEEPRAPARLPAEAGGHVADGLAAGGDGGAAARPGRRLHQPRRCPGRDPAGTTGDPARARRGSTRTATSTRPTRPRRATCGACRSRWPAAVAIPTSSPPSTARPCVRRTPGCSAARSWTRPSRGCSRRARSRTSVPGCWRTTPAGRPSPAGARPSPAGSTAGTSRSTSTSSTAPRAGPWPCPSRMACRSTRRSRPSGSSPRAARRSSASARPR